MPALEPVCARAGALARTSEAAVTSAMAREAGFARHALLGGLAAIIWDKASVPQTGSQTMDGTGHGQHAAGALAAVASGATKPGEYGGSGAVVRRLTRGM